jgi:hypothetical protein
MTRKPGAPFLVTLQALPDAIPARLRVRKALKVLLRSFGLRCLRVEPLPPARPTSPPAEPPR